MNVKLGLPGPSMLQSCVPFELTLVGDGLCPSSRGVEPLPANSEKAFEEQL